MKSLETSGGKGEVGAGRGRLRKRDEELLIALGLARCLTTEQLNRIFRPGMDTDYLARRLRSLADSGTRSAFPGRALIERHDYLRLDRSQGHLWSLSALGAAYVEERAGFAPYYSREFDQRVTWCDHIASVNELFVELVVAMRVAGFEIDKLPFRWRAPGTVRIDWDEMVPEVSEPVRRALSPSVVIDFPQQRLRIFIENDTSAHVVGDPAAGLPTRLKRYDAVFGSVGEAKDGRTFYARHFPDRFRPQLFLLAKTAARQMAMKKVVAEWRSANVLSSVDVHVRSTAELARDLLDFLRRAGVLSGNVQDGGAPEVLMQDVNAFVAYSLRLIGELCGKLNATPPAAFHDSKEKAERALRRMGESLRQTSPARAGK